MIEKTKKKYIKPMIAFEDMQLNSAIATICNLVKVERCQADENGVTQIFSPFTEDIYFTSELSCSFTDLCYHNPDGMVQNSLIGLS